ncbi:hypothetical protein HRbin41_01362 [bacterium HR41]|nr:hypothetical protein HRbin41_01362 [bacterium HR41]
MEDEAAAPLGERSRYFALAPLGERTDVGGGVDFRVDGRTH